METQALKRMRKSFEVFPLREIRFDYRFCKVGVFSTKAGGGIGGWVFAEAPLDDGGEEKALEILLDKVLQLRDNNV